MCGILGFLRASSTSTTMDSDLAGVMTDGMLVGALRGMDSFGYMHQTKAGKVKLEKYPVPAPMMYGTAAWLELRNAAREGQIFVGHHRAKTTGVISKEAAHPYKVTSDKTGRTVWGVHNGSLTTWSTYQNGKNYVTDSQYLFSQIAENGPEALRYINGAYAVAFMMSDKPGKLFIARNKERPLVYGYSKDGKVMLFGSEGDMLNWLVNRPQYLITMNEEFTVAKTAWADVEAHNLYEFDTANPSDVVVHKKLLSPPVVTPPAPPAASTTRGGTGYYDAKEYQKEQYKKRFPTCTDDEINNAIDFEVIGDTVQGVLTRLKKNKEGKVAYASGQIITEDSELRECKFHLRQPPEPFHKILEGKPGEVGISFTIGGCMEAKRGEDLTLVVGELKYVFTAVQEKKILTLHEAGNA